MKTYIHAFESTNGTCAYAFERLGSHVEVISANTREELHKLLADFGLTESKKKPTLWLAGRDWK